jgi:NAD(P)H-dependent FMN reductase
MARWFFESAVAEGGFEVELVDLDKMELPLFDEAKHPVLQQYEHEHTKRWSAKIAEADAFVFVMPEYNYNPPASFVNAIDYLVKEWAHKPAAFVSYGGMSGGIRAVQVAKGLLTALKIMPIPEAVAVTSFTKQIVDGKFTPTEENEKASKVLLSELRRWAEALATLRN